MALHVRTHVYTLVRPRNHLQELAKRLPTVLPIEQFVSYRKILIVGLNMSESGDSVQVSIPAVHTARENQVSYFKM